MIKKIQILLDVDFFYLPLYSSLKYVQQGGASG